MLKRFLPSAVFAAAASLLTACSLGLTDVPDPSTIIDPDLVNTQTGAVGLYNESLSTFNRTFAGMLPSTTSYTSFAYVSGLASDEWTAVVDGEYSLRRTGPSGIADAPNPYSTLHQTRMTMEQAIGALKKYGVTTPSSYIAQLYALRGYISIMLAELYCSGIPFSRAVYGGDIEYGEPLNTTQMLQRAVADFDSALAIQTDSARITRMAYVGKARALLNLGKFGEAAEVASVANVPSTYQYNVTYNATSFPNYLAVATSTSTFGIVYYWMANRQGTNGLPYAEIGADTGTTVKAPIDARLRTYSPALWPTRRFPSKFPNGGAPVPLADGIEARLIEAEAQLQAKQYGAWATILNDLRATGTSTSVKPLPDDSTITASQKLREDVMFRERAVWMFGTGHRMGDLRRLIRQYKRAPREVFPVGIHFDLSSPNNVFSDRVNLEPPKREFDNNPKFNGCLNYDA